MKRHDGVTVLVSSCDSYAATWPPFCHGFNKYWPDCPWPLWFVTNELDPPCGNALKTGKDRNWTAMMRHALSAMGTSVILFMLDDFWLVAPPDTALLREYADIAIRGDADRVALWRCGSEVYDTEDFLDPRLFVFRDDAQYRASLQAAFWRVDAFLKLLKAGESCWAFEFKGSGRSRKRMCIIGVKEMGCLLYPSPVTPSWGSTTVVAGQWMAEAHRYAEEEGISIDFSRNPRGW